MNTFTFISDPGHGWLEVPWTALKRLGLNPQDFSRCSYRNGNTFYLEEDCDAGIFVQAYEKANGAKPEFTEVHQERTFIRALSPIY